MGNFWRTRARNCPAPYFLPVFGVGVQLNRATQFTWDNDQEKQRGWKPGDPGFQPLSTCLWHKMRKLRNRNAGKSTAAACYPTTIITGAARGSAGYDHSWRNLVLSFDLARNSGQRWKCQERCQPDEQHNTIQFIAVHEYLSPFPLAFLPTRPTNLGRCRGIKFAMRLISSGGDLCRHGG